MKFQPNKIIVHHSLTKDSGTVSWGAMRKYHVDILGWNDIGYHAGVELVGDHYEAFFGRPWYLPGAHTKGHNDDSLGFCFVGNFDEEEPSDTLLEAGARVLFHWFVLFKIPTYCTYRHHDFNPNKTCPGRKFDMDKLLNKTIHLATMQLWEGWEE